MKTFLHIIGNTMIATVTDMLVWFALTFWLYLETQSVLATSLLGGSYFVLTSISGFWLGSIVDHHRKKTSLLLSTSLSAICFTGALLLYGTAPEGAYTSLSNPAVWLLGFVTLVGVAASNIRMITIPTLVTILVPEDKRDKANGMSGMVMGLSSSGAGIGSGFALAYAGFGWVLLVGVIMNIVAFIHLALLPVPEAKIIHSAEKPKKVDVRGTIKAIKVVPGLFSLIFFTTFNNFLGGIFVALMDPYGLSLVSVQVWGSLWGILSGGFIIGGILIAKFGLGKNPLKRLFMINIITWTVCIFFTIQPSVILLSTGILIWLICAPFIEASEHTIVQKVVPLERQGRVFGFAQSVEMAASPITAFIIGPIAQFIFIPFMTTGKGVDLIGPWFGTGPGRGIALVFIMGGIIGLIVTIIARHSRSFALLSKQYAD